MVISDRIPWGRPLVVLALTLAGAAAGLVLPAPGTAAAEEELSYREYQAMILAANRLDKIAVLEPPGDKVGMYLVLGDRFGLVHVYHLTHRRSVEIWKSKQLNGIVDEVKTGDMDGDGYDDVFIARTGGGVLYVWDAGTFAPAYESLQTDFGTIHSFTLGNVDDDPATELILNADRKIHYLDGVRFNREWTSLNDYEATRILCGDVDGDRTNELVLNTGQILDSRTGDLKWEEEVFGARIELLDMDGDGIPEVLTESDGGVMKVYDIDHRKEKRL